MVVKIIGGENEGTLPLLSSLSLISLDQYCQPHRRRRHSRFLSILNSLSRFHFSLSLLIVVHGGDDNEDSDGERHNISSFERGIRGRCTYYLQSSSKLAASLLQAVLKQFGAGGYGGSDNMITNEEVQVLERPTFDQSEFGPATQVEHGGDMGRHKDKRGTGSGDSYRVLLIDDDKHNENLVAKNLPQAVPSVTPDDARRLFHVSQENGVAVVIVTVKEHAEFYAQMMIRRGLQSTIEPDSNIM